MSYTIPPSAVLECPARGAQKHNRVSVAPLLQLTPYAEGKTGKNGIYLSNVGLGPAVITGFFFPVQELTKLSRLVQKNAAEFLEAWNEFFGTQK